MIACPRRAVGMAPGVGGAAAQAVAARSPMNGARARYGVDRGSGPTVNGGPSGRWRGERAVNRPASTVDCFGLRKEGVRVRVRLKPDLRGLLDFRGRGFLALAGFLLLLVGLFVDFLARELFVVV